MAKKLVKCKTCGKDVSPSAKACPHCGESTPGVSTAKGCLFFLVISVLLTIGIGMCASPDDKQNQVSVEQNSKWYEGGTLHQSSISDWKKATYNNKLATAADFIYNGSKKIQQLISENGNVDSAKQYAEELVNCIDTAHNEISETDHLQTAESATVCITLMGL